MRDFVAQLPEWLRPGDDRPSEEIDDEVAEELRLHVDLLTEANERQGMPPDKARRTAEARFGDLDLLTRRCRKIKQGDLPMLKRIQTVLTIAAVVGIAVIGWRLYVMDDALTTMSRLLADAQAELKAMRSDLRQPAAATPLASPPATAESRAVLEQQLNVCRLERAAKQEESDRVTKGLKDFRTRLARLQAMDATEFRPDGPFLSRFDAVKAKHASLMLEFERKKKLVDQGIESEAELLEAEKKLRASGFNQQVHQREFDAHVERRKQARNREIASLQNQINVQQQIVRDAEVDLARAQLEVVRAETMLRGSE